MGHFSTPFVPGRNVNIVPSITALSHCSTLRSCPHTMSSIPQFHSPKFTAPRCPRCQLHFLRPGVVWYGQLLAPGTLQRIDDWLDTTTRVDLMLVIGTSGRLSSGFIDDARARGATVAHFNIQYPNHLVEPGDWVVPGDAAITLPPIMEETFSPRNG